MARRGTLDVLDGSVTRECVGCARSADLERGEVQRWSAVIRGVIHGHAGPEAWWRDHGAAYS
jgi:hypothetical protein